MQVNAYVPAPKNPHLGPIRVSRRFGEGRRSHHDPGVVIALCGGVGSPLKPNTATPCDEGVNPLAEVVDSATGVPLCEASDEVGVVGHDAVVQLTEFLVLGVVCVSPVQLDDLLREDRRLGVQ